MGLAVLDALELSDSQFEQIASLVHELCGINLHDGKRELVKARLAKRLRALHLRGFDEYIAYVRGDRTGAELTAMLDALSTNLTSFFREPAHFKHLGEEVFGRLAARGTRRMRIWSAGCSSGEEPYTIAMTFYQTVPDADRWDARILATDLSTTVLARAREGAYPADRVEAIPGNLRAKYFEPVGRGRERAWRVRESLRRMVHFARLNLMGPWPMKGPFDAIFCRNVMIYFDKPTQGRLVGRFWDLLAPGGMFYIGHSESLAGVEHRFRYVQPTVYCKGQ